MKKQDYDNHVRYYAPHHFVFYPIVFALLVYSGVQIFRNDSDVLTWKLFAVAVALIGWFAYMTRQHYALTLQNRIVRLEMRVRYFQLTGQRFEPFEKQLRFGQIAALRFAADHELPELLEKALKENLSTKNIKKQIRDWNPDYMRV